MYIRNGGCLILPFDWPNTIVINFINVNNFIREPCEARLTSTDLGKVYVKTWTFAPNYSYTY